MCWFQYGDVTTSKREDSMHSVGMILASIDYVETNLQEEITVADMARVARYSLFHFARTFNQVTHHAPYDYLMRRRLSESAKDILLTNSNLIDIAFDYCFNSHETFSRAFKRMFGMLPSQVRKQGTLERWQIMPRLTLAHLEFIERMPVFKPELVEKESFDIVGIAAMVGGECGEIEALWDMLRREAESSDREYLRTSYVGVSWFLGDLREERSLYLAAVEAGNSGENSPPLVKQTIPTQTYVVFRHQKGIAPTSIALDYVFYTWLPKSGMRWANPMIFERFGRSDPYRRHADDEIELYIPVAAL
jgi:AraC family transcriptional regulator